LLKPGIPECRLDGRNLLVLRGKTSPTHYTTGKKDRIERGMVPRA
jgi:hypothetical protein